MRDISWQFSPSVFKLVENITYCMDDTQTKTIETDSPANTNQSSTGMPIVGLPETRFQHSDDCNLSIAVINHTPVVDPEDTIKLSVYLLGHGVPEKNKLDLIYNPSIINESNPGEIRTYVKRGENTKQEQLPDGTILPPGTVFPVGEEQTVSIDIHGTYVGIREGMFFPAAKEQSSRNFPPIVSHSRPICHAPIELEINLSNCDSGDYQIPIVLTYGSDEEISQTREDAVIHVNSKTEKYRWHIAAGGLLLALFGLILSAGIAEVILIPALENLVS